ncbi:MAG: PIN domain-containing protein [Dethiobacter sp.]|jgi:predicted nucleic acid-binding protein|nr:PIN domain-containing protein [Dethiobacter sp.]MBS3900959.1 PIN domain-containing protein [Dethiobacter sp.]MBS3988554.1 PIN domain-containing protein [Dethiobacter sp.]
MKDKFFIDTNIILYLFDKDNDRKREIAKSILQSALNKDCGVVSYQVVQEFCNAALRKFVVPFTIDDCKYFINRFLFPICEIFPGIELYNIALDIKQKSGYGFYDSLIIASSIQTGCSILYTEDLQHNQDISGLKIVNPFT